MEIMEEQDNMPKVAPSFRSSGFQESRDTWKNLVHERRLVYV